MKKTEDQEFLSFFFSFVFIFCLEFYGSVAHTVDVILELSSDLSLTIRFSNYLSESCSVPVLTI